ncbi:DedA family protein [Buchananella hordeovulneris]|nr:DedA family protein [Buchananella hordeovulneris]
MGGHGQLRLSRGREGRVDWLQDLLVAAGSSPWALVLVLAFCIVDAVFPAVPSESSVITLAVLATTTGSPNLWLVLAVAVSGAFVGDIVTFHLGRRVPLERLRFLRGQRAQSAIGAARTALQRRGTLLILSARFIPVGRVAVNLVAGATGFPRRRFVATALLAAVTWGLISISIGTGVGHFLHDYPLVGVAVGVCVGVVVGVAVDKLVALLARLLSRRQPVKARPGGRD